MEKKILEICKELCCREISYGEPLITTGILDSYKIMEIMCNLEEEFHITFLPEEISDMENFSTVNNMIALCKRKILYQG